MWRGGFMPVLGEIVMMVDYYINICINIIYDGNPCFYNINH